MRRIRVTATRKSGNGVASDRSRVRRVSGRSGVAWHEHEGLDDTDVARLVRRVRDRVLRALRRAGKWWEEGDAADADVELDGEQQLLLALASGGLTGRAALGARAG